MRRLVPRRWANGARPITFWENEVRSKAGLIVVFGLLAIVFGQSFFVAFSAAASPRDNITGTWNCCYDTDGGAAAQNFVITSGSSSLAGTAVLPSGDVFATITGYDTDGVVKITTTYSSIAPGYVATFTGFVSSDGNSMSGVWASNRSQSGTWSATRSGHTPPGGASPPVPIALTSSGLHPWEIAAIVLAGFAALIGAAMLFNGGVPASLSNALLSRSRTGAQGGASSGEGGSGPADLPQGGASSGDGGSGPGS
jgi:hypothetical protein